MVHNLSEQPSLISEFVAQLRNIEVQKDRMRFRRNVERIGEIMAYEISKHLAYEAQMITTPISTAAFPLLKEQPILATVFRAGLPFHQGMLNYFDAADSAFVSAYRNYTSEKDFEINIEYLACPHIEGRTLIIADPMLATARSMKHALEALLTKGKPSMVHIACVIASRTGLNYITKHYPEAHIWLGALDEELNAHAYIVPGLGDAGDLSYGEKCGL